MTPPPVFLSHPSSLDHDTGGHPEQPARITAINQALAAGDWYGYLAAQSPAVSRDVLTTVHPPAYVDAIERICADGGGQLDLDTVASPGSFEAALHACGGAVRLVDLLLDGGASTGFSAHRPPGHHALPARAMGFCLFNSVAVAARYAVSQRGLARVLILDWDVHHGNGTNDIFYEDNQVLFVSIHQWPLYPGTGAASDVGSGNGVGYTVNLPVPPGSGDDVFESLVGHVVVPLALAFRPELVLLSAGYDAHRDDPLANCSVSDDGYLAMTRLMRRVSAELGAPVGAVLEGGYSLGALARAVPATMGELASSAYGGEPVAPVTPLAREAVMRLSPWWDLPAV